MFTHLSIFKLIDKIKPTSSATKSSEDSSVSSVTEEPYSGTSMCSATGALFLAKLWAGFFLLPS